VIDIERRGHIHIATLDSAEFLLAAEELAGMEHLDLYAPIGTLFDLAHEIFNRFEQIFVGRWPVGREGQLIRFLSACRRAGKPEDDSGEGECSAN